MRNQSVYFLVSAFRGVLPKDVALIRDNVIIDQNDMVCETLISGSLLMQNLRLCLKSKRVPYLRLWRVQRLLRIAGALSALSGHS
jgi:hypothetical protein